MAIADIVWGLAAPLAEEKGVTLWDVEFKKEGTDYFLRVYIDKNGGVSIDDCEAVSRALDPILDKVDPIAQSYYLEVCSAGLIRDLKTDAQILAFLGSEAEIHIYKSEDKLPKRFTAVLTACTPEMLSVEFQGELREISRKNISKIKIDLV